MCRWKACVFFSTVNPSPAGKGGSVGRPEEWEDKKEDIEMKGDGEVALLKERVAILEQKELIRDVIHRYVYAIDSKDMEKVMTVFHEDIHFHYVNLGLEYRGKKNTRKFYEQLFETYDLILHKIMNIMIQVKNQEASAQNYWSVYEIFKGGGDRFAEGHHYHKLVNTKDGWKMIELVAEGDYTRVVKQDILVRTASPR
jgi:ketosteroid isomerase-like protein